MTQPRETRVRHWLKVGPVIALPIIVGVGASLVLGTLSAREQTTRDARLVVGRIHEAVVVHETLLSHAMVMGEITSDLPERVEELRSAVERNLDELGGLVADAEQVDHIRAAWTSYAAAADEPLGAFGASASSGGMDAAGMTADDGGTAPSGEGHMGGMADGEPQDPPAEDHDHAEDMLVGTRTSDKFAALDAAIDDADAVFRQLAVDKSRAARVGTVATLVVVMLILGLAFWVLERVRRTAALADASREILATSEARFRSLVQNASDVVTVVDPDARVTYQTPSIEHVLGYSPNDLTGRLLSDVLHPGDLERFSAFLAQAPAHRDVSDPAELRLKHRDRRWVHVEALARDLTGDPTVGGLVLTIRDITERKDFEAQLAHQAFHDPLTDLANRELFADRLAHALARRDADATRVAVLNMDIDNFKTINDTLGHAAGDKVLMDVAEVIRGCVRAADTAGRLGGDEFGIVLEDVAGMEEAQEVAQRILSRLERAIDVEGDQVVVQASIGIALGTRGETDAEELLRNADIAMYRVKGDGKAGIRLFEPEMHAAVSARAELKADLQRALHWDQLVLHYQPMVDMRTGAVVGAEALLRWEHPEHGLIPPLEFIPLAEESGLIISIGRWVLEQACRQAQAWQERSAARRKLSVSVNVSAKQLERPGIIAEVADALRNAQLDPSLLVVEITESVMLHHSDELVERLHALKDLGVNLAIDDFGSGYSSLRYLRNLPVDMLKIDKSFVDNVHGESRDAALASAIITLGDTLAMGTVAEGVELEEQAAALNRLGCGFAQGYLFAKPLTVEAFTDLLAAPSAAEAPLAAP